MSRVKSSLALESGGRVARLPARSVSEDGQPASRPSETRVGAPVDASS